MQMSNMGMSENTDCSLSSLFQVCLAKVRPTVKNGKFKVSICTGHGQNAQNCPRYTWKTEKGDLTKYTWRPRLVANLFTCMPCRVQTVQLSSFICGADTRVDHCGPVLSMPASLTYSPTKQPMSGKVQGGLPAQIRTSCLMVFIPSLEMMPNESDGAAVSYFCVISPRKATGLGG